MNDTQSSLAPTQAGAPPAATDERIDLFWGSALCLALLGIFLTTMLPGLLGIVLGVTGMALAGAAAVIAFKQARRVSWGALVAFVAALFTAIVGGRPAHPPTIALKDAPRLRAPDGSGLPNEVEQAFARGGESYFHPGPVALGFGGLAPLSAEQLRPTGLVAAAWDGAWFAANVLSLNGGNARVRFIGWESAWDVDVPTSSLRGLSPDEIPKAPSADQVVRLGSLEPQPGDFKLSVYQPAGGLVNGADLAALTANATLYASKLDLSGAPVSQAIPSFQGRDDQPLGLVAEGLLHFADAGQRYFGVSGVADGGASKLWLDGALLDLTKPVNLDDGVHQLRLEYRHPPGTKLSLGLRTGTDPKALRVLDLKRDGVAQSTRERDGGLRVVLAEGVLFDLDKDELKPSSERALSSIYASSIAPAPTVPVRVEGHTDDRGGDEHNLDLSRRRAERVRGWLVAHGRSDSGLSTQAFGERKPRVPNDSDQHRRANRRVELVLGGSGVAASAAPVAAAPAITAAPSPATGGADQPVLDLLHLYYKELNDGSFDANHYFEPSIERYITMMGTSTAAVNHYIRDIFPTQFKQPHFELEEGSLTAEGPGQYVFVEHSRYVMARKTQVSDKRVRVRIRLSPAGKVVFLHQFQRLG